MQCEGWIRTGGAFTLGPVKWEQCKSDAVVELTVIQDEKQETFPACQICWKEGIEKSIVIKEITPLQS